MDKTLKQGRSNLRQQAEASSPEPTGQGQREDTTGKDERQLLVYFMPVLNRVTGFSDSFMLDGCATQFHLEQPADVLLEFAEDFSDFETPRVQTPIRGWAFEECSEIPQPLVFHENWGLICACYASQLGYPRKWRIVAKEVGQAYV